MSDGGKGSARRPGDHAGFLANFDRIFGSRPRPEFIPMGDSEPVIPVVMPEGQHRNSANDDQAQ
jgi:hypothetical protein